MPLEDTGPLFAIASTASMSVFLILVYYVVSCHQREFGLLEYRSQVFISGVNEFYGLELRFIPYPSPS